MWSQEAPLCLAVLISKWRREAIFSYPSMKGSWRGFSTGRIKCTSTCCYPPTEGGRKLKHATTLNSHHISLFSESAIFLRQIVEPWAGTLRKPDKLPPGLGASVLVAAVLRSKTEFVSLKHLSASDSSPALPAAHLPCPAHHVFTSCTLHRPRRFLSSPSARHSKFPGRCRRYLGSYTPLVCIQRNVAQP